MKQRAEQIASNQLLTFEQDRAQRAQLSGTLVNTVKESQAHVSRILPTLKLLSARANYLATYAANSRMHQAALNLLVNAVLGNKDNKGYYLMDGAANWIERRLPSVADGDTKEKMEDARNAILLARDALDATGRSFGIGMMTMRKQMDANQWDKVKDTASDMQAKVTSSPVGKLFADALNKVELVRSKLSLNA